MSRDISRLRRHRQFGYTTVHMQQGRVQLDSDWNEAQDIANVDRRRGRIDIIGPAGSPDDGFHIINPHVTADGLIDFDIEAGRFYLGGILLSLDELQSFLAQSDWLLGSGDSVAAPTDERFDLVYLEAYEQPVTTTEDGETAEPALGGPDTATRMRTIRRVHVMPDVGVGDCAEAWQVLVDAMADAGLGALNADHALEVDTTLMVSFAANGDADDLCSPSVLGGYLGAENQSIRVQIVADDTLTWGFNNGSPMYRVFVGADRQTVEFLTLPADQMRWPQTGQHVELYPPAAQLPNGEHTAEQLGHLSRVDGAYDPESNSITLTTAIPTAEYDAWTDLVGPDGYLYLRVWDRGADRSSDPAIAFTPGVPLALGHTGLEVTIDGDDRVPGNFWIIAARPHTPTRVLPWDLETGRGPDGVQHLVAPLAVIHWQPDGDALAATVHDCRDPFRPLTRQQNCCSYTVGDGVHSHGHFDSIQEAVDRLPESGGDICLLPGTHEANVVLEGRTNITIQGCGNESKVIPGPDALQDPIFTVRDSNIITLRNMDMATVDGTAIVLEASQLGALQTVEIAHNRILAGLNAIHAMLVVDLHIHNNAIRMLDKTGGDVAIFVLSEDGLIERNDLGVIPAGTLPPPGDDPRDPTTDPSDPCADPEAFYADVLYLVAFFEWALTLILTHFIPQDPYITLGGIQVGSGSERIDIVRNVIAGGAGNGITLGSDLALDDLPPLPDDDQTGGITPQLGSFHGVIAGQVVMNNLPVPDLPLTFEDENGDMVTRITGEEGEFEFFAPALQYRVFVGDPAYVIASVETVEDGQLYILTVREVGPRVDLLSVLDFIYDVDILDNEIAGMGLSGIGVPQVDLDSFYALSEEDLETLSALAKNPLYLLLVVLFGILTGFVINLRINGNHITNCLRNVQRSEKRPELLGLGQGGISLALCENLLINENRIERNGAEQTEAVTGIFALFVNQLDISANHVLDNGPTDIGADLTELQSGLWGGVMVPLAMGLAVPGADQQDEVPNTGHAARIYDNTISQPVGRALTLGAFGPVAVVNNWFHSVYNGLGLLDRLAGAVLVINLGGFQNLILAYLLRSRYLKGQFGQIGASEDLFDTLFDGGEEGAAADRPIEELEQQRSLPVVALWHPRLPTGNILFNDNQTQLSTAVNCLAAQVVLTADDLDLSDNQSSILSTVFPLLRALGGTQGLTTGFNQLADAQLAKAAANIVLYLNTLAVGLTLRATSNRFNEPLFLGNTPSLVRLTKGIGGALSLFSLALYLNNTCLNQGNHCIVSVSLADRQSPGQGWLVAQGNQSINPHSLICKHTLDDLSLAQLGRMLLLMVIVNLFQQNAITTTSEG